ncbi:HypC/HybG/HupF family hydrogenase formation chaperone [Paenibacillus albiflavus]|uniref:HypC/HybG/HupF family hydrogenase formation chaperone n=1 Tax=Paenibacillus albiflavus TaxID=2545760 RepID=A0A4R4EFA3_9BACL|nr:HypC/HybG/HupF family hydrogenase formation chaperone [Paenibacillus albiflavus]TCZ78237.1 HypC/HybG/HupF family hydrogenase formation chaperone [Paenibacillus albiflavus]
MCVGVPAQVIEIDQFAAIVDVMGSRMQVGIIFVPEVEVGQYVIVHAGQAMSIIDEDYARDSLEEWRRLIDARAAESTP